MFGDAFSVILIFFFFSFREMAKQKRWKCWAGLSCEKLWGLECLLVCGITEGKVCVTRHEADSEAVGVSAASNLTFRLSQGSWYVKMSHAVKSYFNS